MTTATRIETLQHRIDQLTEQNRALVSTLEYLSDQWADEFDNDKPINGGDFVQWYGEVLALHIRPALAPSRYGVKGRKA